MTTLGAGAMDMWELAADLGLEVVGSPRHHRSGYAPGDNTIHLRRGMTSRITRSVLAHEIAHHLLGHHPTLHGPARSRQERAANEWAALRIITPDGYAHAEHLHHGNPTLMAAELHVADELLTAYQARLLRLGPTVYVDPREGTGQYAHRIQVA